MRRSLLFLFLAVGLLSSTAKERPLQQLMQEARTVLMKQAANGLQRRTVASMQLDVIQRSSQLTVVGGEAGFAIIANDDRFDAVLGYSDKEYDVNHVAPAYQWWLNAINEQLEYNIEHGVEPVSVLPQAPLYATSVAQLMITEWGQSAPYYNMTPTYTSGKNDVHYVTGCVATAMAQIMYYYRWPAKGKGSVSYYFTPEGSSASQKLSDNLGKTPYDWDNMLPVYKGVSYTEAQGNAVALLMKHCGYSVQMQYTRTGSGAYTSDAADALRKKFYYNENMHFYRRDFFPVNEWMEKIFSELNDGCPVLYGAQSSDGGHEFVLDGYDENGKVHVNWGWDGSQNGYFDIASLNGYSSGQEMVLVRKNDVIIPYQSYWGMNGSMTITNPSVTALNASFTAYNLDYNSFTGLLGLVTMNLTTGVIKQLASVEMTNTEYLHGGRPTYSNVDISNMPDGTYRIYAASFATGKDTEWQPIRAHESSNNSYILTIVNGQISLQPENNSNWTTAIDDIESMETTSPIRYYDLQGREVDASHRGLTIVRQGGSVKKVVR